MPVHSVLIPLFDGFQPLDVTGPYEVLMGATTLLDVLASGTGPSTGYRVSLVAATAGPVTARGEVK